MAQSNLDPSQDVFRALEALEEFPGPPYLTRYQSYKTIQSLLAGCSITDEYVKRLLSVSVVDLKEDMKLVAVIVDIIKILAVKNYPSSMTQEIVKTADAILTTLKTMAQESKVKNLQTVCFETLLVYSTEVYALLPSSCTDLSTVISAYLHESVSLPLKLMVFNFMLKVLKSLPDEERKDFAGKYQDTWFSIVIPTAVSIICISDTNTEAITEMLDLLVDSLSDVTYNNNIYWKQMFQNICVRQKYPAVMKSLLDSNNDAWCSLWIFFVKLLNTDITRYNQISGSPVNSILPIVEAAFKMDSKRRCQAFHCWMVLTNNFAKETQTNTAQIVKRMKLLRIPLMTNNAKCEVVAIAKLNTWWNVLVKFQRTIDQNPEIFFTPFLYFCFGKPTTTQQSLVPGLISGETRKRATLALAEICGLNVGFEKRMLSGKLLQSNLMTWLHILHVVITKADSLEEKKKLQFIWKSIVLLALELPDVNRDMVLTELFNTITKLVKDAGTNGQLSDTILNVVLLSDLFQDSKARDVLKLSDSTKDSVPYIGRIIQIVLDPAMYPLYTSSQAECSISLLRPLTDAILDKTLRDTNELIKWLLPILPNNDNGLMLWTSLMESAHENNSHIDKENIRQLLLWPLNHHGKFKHVHYSSSIWHKFYVSLKEKLSRTSLGADLVKIVSQEEHVVAFNLFKIYALVQVIENELKNDNDTGCIVMAEHLECTLKRFLNKKCLEPLGTLINATTHCLISMLAKCNTGDTFVSLCELTLTAFNHTLEYIVTSLLKNSDITIVDLSHLEKIYKQLNELFQKQAYIQFAYIVIDSTISCLKINSKHEVLKNLICMVLKTVVLKSKKESPLYKKVQDAITTSEGIENPSPLFTAPTTVKTPKNKNLARITGTVVENGEVFEVIKSSNWKSFPKKMTESQKEKLKRKREDIPALYQDLSQSQDEFKSHHWKTDSQDTSTSSSKSINISCNDVCSILQVNGSECIPKIMENNFVPTDIKLAKINESASSPSSVSKLTKIQSPTTPKLGKSPRMALKDRVLQNVKMLKEKSTTQKTDDAMTEMAEMEEICRTPTSKFEEERNVTHSAPSQTTSRPARVRKMPKRLSEFEDLYSPNSDRNFECQVVKEPLTKKNKKSITIMKQTADLGEETKTALSLKSQTSNRKSTATIDQTVGPSDVPPVNNDGETEKKTPEPEIEKKTLKSAECTDNLGVGIRTNMNIPNDILQSEVVKTADEIAVPIMKQTVDLEVAESIMKPKHTCDSIFIVDISDISPDENEDTSPISMERQAQASRKRHTVSKNSEILDKLQKVNSESSKQEKPSKSLDSSNINFDGNLMKNGNTSTTQIKNNAKTSNTENCLNKSSFSAKEKNCTKLIANKSLFTNDEVQKSVVKDCIKDCRILIQNISPTESPVKVKDVVIKITEKDNIAIDAKATSGKNFESRIESKSKANTKDTKSKESHLDDNLSLNIKTKNVKQNDEEIMESCPQENTLQCESINSQTGVSGSTNKKKIRKSRIESELAIDTVEGHPVLKMFTKERVTRKSLLTPDVGKTKRKRLPKMLKVLSSNSKSGTKSLANKIDKTQNKEVKVPFKKADTSKDVILLNSESSSTSVSNCEIDLPMSEDFIESSQDSTLTTISIKSTKSTKKAPIVLLKDSVLVNSSQIKSLDTSVDILLSNNESKQDIQFSQNKSVVQESNIKNLTSEMDTEPIELNNQQGSGEVISMNVSCVSPIVSHDNCIGQDTMEIAEADTEPMDPNFLSITSQEAPIVSTQLDVNQENDSIQTLKDNEELINTADDITLSVEPADNNSANNANSLSSPLSDEAQRKEDFLNNTLEISPIKILSPINNERIPTTPEKSDDILIRLSPPVQMDGVPFEKSTSPEVFTEEKVSPDKREPSSPSSSLSLKKNRPQMRTGGRAAQMLELCVPDKLKSIMINERLSEVEEPKKVNTITTQARRNLRIFYNTGKSLESRNEESSDEGEDNDNILRFTKTVPAADSSPSVPILKRQFAEIADEATVSPASKKKRVSFNDPIHSSMMIHKYIEPISMRSPQSSNVKRSEKKNRAGNMKSPKKLENMFQLESPKPTEIQDDVVSTNSPDDTEMSSIEETPLVEVVINSDLNNSIPICEELIDCSDPICNIATELSSPTMKDMLIQELEDNVRTIGDLASMTELEINRLCIKAPKVQVAKKALNDYAAKILPIAQDLAEINSTLFKGVDVEVQTTEIPKPTVVEIQIQTDSKVKADVDAQTEQVIQIVRETQTSKPSVSQTEVQTEETGMKTTRDIFLSLSERCDYTPELLNAIQSTDEDTKRQMAKSLPSNVLLDAIKSTDEDTKRQIAESLPLNVLINVINKNFNKLKMCIK